MGLILEALRKSHCFGLYKVIRRSRAHKRVTKCFYTSPCNSQSPLRQVCSKRHDSRNTGKAVAGSCDSFVHQCEPGQKTRDLISLRMSDCRKNKLSTNLRNDHRIPATWLVDKRYYCTGPIVRPTSSASVPHDYRSKLFGKPPSPVDF